MPEFQWSAPLEIDLQGTGVFTKVTGPRQALTMLRKNWPLPFGMKYEFAKSKCFECLAGKADLDSSRDAMLVAAQEAAIRIKLELCDLNGRRLDFAFTVSQTFDTIPQEYTVT